VVELTGARSGEAPLTWGQRAIWNAIGRTAPADHYFNLSRELVLTDRLASTVDDVRWALGQLMARHEALRTRVRVVDGEPRQLVAASGRLPIRVAAAVPADLAADRFDYAGEWPLRVALVTRDGLVRTMVLAFCHLAVDGHGAELVVQDLRLLLRAARRGRATPPAPARRQPLDLAHAEASPEGRQDSATALAYWRRELDRLPPTMFATPLAEPERPRFWTARIVSRAIDYAVDRLATRHRVSTSTVLLAASGALVGAATGHRRCAIMPIVSNRFQADHQELVTTLSQDGLLVLDFDALEEPTFGALVPSAWRAGLRAYRHARYDPDAWDRLFAELSRDRGVPTHPYCCFNDMRLVDRPTGLADGSAALADPRLEWTARHERVACRFCLHITSEPAGLSVSLTADTRYLPPGLIERYLSALEMLLVSAVDREVPLAELPRLLAGARTPAATDA